MINDNNDDYLSHRLDELGSQTLEGQMFNDYNVNYLSHRLDELRSQTFEGQMINITMMII